jgi:hypothetical protein
MNTLLDYPANGMVTCQSGTNAYVGCFKCPEWGVYSKLLRKMVCDENVRRNLPLAHPYRTDPAFGEPETRAPLPQRTHAEKEQSATIVETLQGAAKKRVIKSTGVRGRSSLFDVPHFDVARGPKIDPTHTLANVGHRLRDCISGKNDTKECRLDMQSTSFQNSDEWIVLKPVDRSSAERKRKSKGRMAAEEPEGEENEETFPPVDWVASGEDFKTLVERTRMRVPTFFGTRPETFFQPGELKCEESFFPVLDVFSFQSLSIREFGGAKFQEPIKRIFFNWFGC